jgi:LPXTG-motif cell wall-anchored protein
MKKRTLFIILAAGLFIALSGQHRNGSKYLQWHKDAMRLYDLEEPTESSDSMALHLLLNVVATAMQQDKPIVVESLIKAGNIYQGKQRFGEANQLYYQAIALNNAFVKNEAFTYEAYLFLGSSHYFSNIIDSAQYYFEAASEIALQYTGKQILPEKETLYNSLGAIYYESANYQQAKNYFERALEFSSTSAQDYTDVYNGIQSNIANCLMKLNQYDSALQIFKSLKPDEQQKDIIRQNTAHSFFELGKYDSALAIYLSLPVSNGYAGVVALTNMGRIYMKREQWQEAEKILDSAIARSRGISVNIKNKEEALAYLYRSQLARDQGLQDEAITWVNEALQEVHLNFRWKSNNDLPDDISKTVSPITLFNILYTKASLYYSKYRLTGQASWLTGSLAAYRKAIETANFIKLNFDNDEAKLFFNENYRSIYNEAIGAAYEAAVLNSVYIDDYLFLIENYKGSVLYQSLQNMALKTRMQVPDSIQRREKELKQLIGFYTSRLNQSAAEVDAAQLQKRLLSLQVDLSRLQKSFEQDAVYNLYKYQKVEHTQTLRYIQSALDEETALLNYVAGDSIIYGLVITKDKVLLKRVNADSLFYRSFGIFIQEVYRYEEGKRYEGFDASATLYRYLVAPFERLTGTCKKWVIIPDGRLYYLPFEAMVKNGAERNYLMLSKTISYHYSVSLLLEKNTHHRQQGNEKGVIAYAPYAFPDDKIKKSNLPYLPLSDEDAGTGSSRIYTGSVATKQHFFAQAGTYPVIHLSTHASTGIDSSSNWIQFYPADSLDVNNKLFVQEIYNLDLHSADLVILSACETGGGIASSGEGLLSLSRAFLYAGADGIVSTLWKTEDRVTSFLMQRMHRYLAQQIPPETALQMAKRDLLQDKSIGSQYKTPNYWSSFIYVGKLHTAGTGSKGYLWWLVGGMVVLTAGIYLLLRKRKKTLSTFVR